MFDFEKLIVYQKAKEINREIYQSICSDKTIDRAIINQLRRASLSIPLNIAEGTSRYSKADRRNFYVIARGSAFECVAILDILKDEKNISGEKYIHLYRKTEELSRILFSMIKTLTNNSP